MAARLSAFAANYNHFDSVDNDATIRKERERRGCCAGCGTKCYWVQKDYLTAGRRQQFVPITVDGVVRNGRCLYCHPDRHHETTGVTENPPMNNHRFVWRSDVCNDGQDELPENNNNEIVLPTVMASYFIDDENDAPNTITTIEVDPDHFLGSSRGEKFDSSGARVDSTHKLITLNLGERKSRSSSPFLKNDNVGPIDDGRSNDDVCPPLPSAPSLIELGDPVDAATINGFSEYGTEFDESDSSLDINFSTPRPAILCPLSSSSPTVANSAKTRSGAHKPLSYDGGCRIRQMKELANYLMEASSSPICVNLLTEVSRTILEASTSKRRMEMSDAFFTPSANGLDPLIDALSSPHPYVRRHAWATTLVLSHKNARVKRLWYERLDPSWVVGPTFGKYKTGNFDDHDVDESCLQWGALWSLSHGDERNASRIGSMAVTSVLDVLVTLSSKSTPNCTERGNLCNRTQRARRLKLLEWSIGFLNVLCCGRSSKSENEEDRSVVAGKHNRNLILRYGKSKSNIDSTNTMTKIYDDGLALIVGILEEEIMYRNMDQPKSILRYGCHLLRSFLRHELDFIDPVTLAPRMKKILLIDKP